MFPTNYINLSSSLCYFDSPATNFSYCQACPPYYSPSKTHEVNYSYFNQEKMALKQLQWYTRYLWKSHYLISKDFVFLFHFLSSNPHLKKNVSYLKSWTPCSLLIWIGMSTVGWDGTNVLVGNGYFFRFQRKIVGNLFQFANGAQDLQSIVCIVVSK